MFVVEYQFDTGSIELVGSPPVSFPVDSGRKRFYFVRSQLEVFGFASEAVNPFGKQISLLLLTVKATYVITFTIQHNTGLRFDGPEQLFSGTQIPVVIASQISPDPERTPDQSIPKDNITLILTQKGSGP
jgi:hypothetical protein